MPVCLSVRATLSMWEGRLRKCYSEKSGEKERVKDSIVCVFSSLDKIFAEIVEETEKIH